MPKHSSSRFFKYPKTRDNSAFVHSGSFIPGFLQINSSLYDDILVDEFSLQGLEAGLFATILEDALYSLKILSETNNDLRAMSTAMDMDKIRGVKFSVEQSPCTDPLAEYDPRRIYCDEYKLKKLKNDWKLTVDTLMPTYRALVTSLSYKPLWEAVNWQLAQEQQVVDIVAEEETSNRTEKELRRKLRLQRNKQNASLYDYDVTIDNLTRLIEDAQLMEETKMRYIGDWQNARTEQHHHIMYSKENQCEKVIYRYKLQMDQETRVHSEAELLVNILIEETLKEVEYWMNKYDTDMEAIDLSTQVMKSDYQKMMDRRIYLEDTIERHGKEIAAWTKFKQDREKANEYFNNMTRSAIIVQAWWRGLLVRKELGPYRPTKKGKKGGKKKKGEE